MLRQATRCSFEWETTGRSRVAPCPVFTPELQFGTHLSSRILEVEGVFTPP